MYFEKRIRDLVSHMNSKCEVMLISLNVAGYAIASARVLVSSAEPVP